MNSERFRAMSPVPDGDMKDRDKPVGYYSGKRPEMLDFVPPTAKKVLDVGCGEGGFGAALKKKDMEIWGVEISGESALIAQEHLDRVMVGDVIDLLDALPDRYFDCIVFNDVLEHLVDPYTILLRIKGKLSEAGVVVCSIPNVRYLNNLKKLLLEKQWQYEEWGILDKTHLRFFTEKSIHEMFDRLGYQIVKMEGISALKPSWKFTLLNFFLFGHLSDTLFLQFACVVKVVPDSARGGSSTLPLA
jgi:2-polyprenyl-3-methyl-5-hydroxy-6-metoxy-1,4-benzoquinol methylase